MPPSPIVIDTDIGADTDDAIALAPASPEFAVLGVTEVAGDVGLRSRTAARLLGLAGRPDVPVVPGARRPLGSGRGPTMLGTEGDGLFEVPIRGRDVAIVDGSADEWLCALARERRYHLVAIGPLTNVALAFSREPQFARRLLGLSIVGGVWDESRLPRGWRDDVARRGAAAAWPDHNTASDPEAALACAPACRRHGSRSRSRCARRCGGRRWSPCRMARWRPRCAACPGRGHAAGSPERCRPATAIGRSPATRSGSCTIR